MSRFNVGGTAEWLYQLSTGLSKKGIENQLLIGECADSEIEDTRINQISHKRISGLGQNVNLSKSLSSLITLRREIKTYKPDVINTHTSKAGVLGRIAAITIRNRPAIVHTYHGHVFGGYFNPILEKSIQFIEFLLSLVTDKIFVLGKKNESDLRKLRIVRTNNVYVVLPGIPKFKGESRNLIRKSLGIDKQALVVGWLGRKVPIKRLDRVLELSKHFPRVIFLIAGVGPNLQTGSNKTSLPNFKEVGFRKPEEFWPAVDIALLTSDNEGIPTSCIEAALAGLPIVSTNVGSINEIVINGETGFLTDRNLEELSQAIRTLIDNSKLRKKMGEKAKSIAIQKFNPQASSNLQIQGYKLAIQKRLS